MEIFGDTVLGKDFWKIFRKRKSVFIYLTIVGILLAGCMVLAVTSRSVWTVSGNAAFKQGMPEQRIVYGQLSLKPGIYQICLHYSTDRDYSAHCDVRDETVRQGALRTNGEHFYAGLGQTGFYLWLLRPARDLQIFVDYEGDAYVETGELVIRNTGKLWSVAFVLVFLTGLLLPVMALLFRACAVSREVRMTAVGLGLITLLASFSQLGGYLLGGADLTYHLQRIEGAKDSLLSGQFPVRIEPEWLYGHGYASGIFYCDALLYLPALFRLAGFTITTSYNIYCICLNLATVWIAWYCFRGIFKDGRIGLMCSALYTLSIIRLYKLAIVGAVGEGSAITFLPLIFYGMYRVFATNPEQGEAGKQQAQDERENRKTWLLLASGYAGLIQTHVLTCEITAFLTVLICILCVRHIVKPTVFWTLAKGALGAVGLSFWYLIPFLDYYITQDMHIRHVSGRTIQGRGLHFSQLFVNAWTDSVKESLKEKGFVEVVPVSPGALCMLALALFLAWWLWQGIRQIIFRISEIQSKIKGGKNQGERAGRDREFSAQAGAIRRTAKLSAVFACLLLFMTLRDFPWDWVQNLGRIPAALVSSLQFPNRFMGWAMVFLIMLFGSIFWYFKEVRGLRCTYLVGGILTALGIATASYGLMRDAVTEEHRLYLYNEAGMGFGYISGAEYLIEGTDDLLLTFAGPVAGENVTIADYQKRYLRTELTCENSGEEESHIDLPLLLYKGYHATAEDGTALTVCYGYNNLVRVKVPARYSGKIRVRFVSPLYWRLSELVTLATFLGITASFKTRWMCRRGKHKTHSLRAKKTEVKEHTT